MKKIQIIANPSFSNTKDFLEENKHTNTVFIGLKEKHLHNIIVNSSNPNTNFVIAETSKNITLEGNFIEYYKLDIFSNILYLGNKFNEEKLEALKDVLGKLLHPTVIISTNMPSFLQKETSDNSNVLESLYAFYTPKQWITCNGEDGFTEVFDETEFINLEQNQTLEISYKEKYSYQ